MTRNFLSLLMLVLLVSTQSMAASSVEDTDLFEALVKKFKDSAKGAILQVPSGLNLKPQSATCDLRRLEDRLLRKTLSTAGYFKEVKNYFEKCDEELSETSLKGTAGLVQFALYQYPFLSHPQVQRIQIPLADGTQLQGMLAMRPDDTPRPLVVYLCGVFCSATEFVSLRNYLMALYDQSPFNVLLLGNQTGMDYIAANKVVTLAGWSEGPQMLEVGQWMRKKWQYKERISSLHFMAESLGGNAAVFAATFNDRFLMEDGGKVFNSVAAICPMISLRPTLDKLYRSTLIGELISIQTRHHLWKAGKYVKDVPDLLTSSQLPTSAKAIPGFIGKLASTSLNRRGIASTPEEFFKSNNFWNWKIPVTTPLLVWASEDDMIVNNQVNTKIMAESPHLRNSETVGVVNLRYGSHCGFSSVYGAQTTATILKTFVLAHSPEFIETYRQKRTQAWTFGSISWRSQFEHLSQSWKFEAGSASSKVSFKLINRFIPKCDGPWKLLPFYCFSEKTFSVPITAISELGGRVPRTEAEAQSLTREFNSKVEFRSGQEPLNGTRSNTISMMWSPVY